MNARNLLASLASAFLLALVFVPSGGAAAALEDSDNPCTGVLDSSCIHCHVDGVCIACNNNGGYINLGTSQVNHIAGNHCWHG